MARATASEAVVSRRNPARAIILLPLSSSCFVLLFFVLLFFVLLQTLQVQNVSCLLFVRVSGGLAGVVWSGLVWSFVCSVARVCVRVCG